MKFFKFQNSFASKYYMVIDDDKPFYWYNEADQKWHLTQEGNECLTWCEWLASLITNTTNFIVETTKLDVMVVVGSFPEIIDKK